MQLPFPAKFLTPVRLLMLLGSSTAYAQAPYITTLSPVRNAVAAPRAGNVALTFSQAMSAASAGNVRVFSAQRGGQLVRAGGGTVSGGGTNTITFDPLVGFRPGETVMVTVPASVQSTSGQAATKHVYQFTAAASGIGRGTFVASATTPILSPGSGTMAVGDIDGDGDLDLLTVNAFNSVSKLNIRLNDGSATFSGTTELPTSSRPTSVIFGDVDDDGDIDILTAHEDATVSVWLNSGTGSFATPQSVAVGYNPQGVTLGDLDADGDLDLITANANAYSLSVRFNNGSGTFSGGSDPGVSGGPWGMAIGDADGDGDLDIFVADANFGTVSIYRNNGLGVFNSTTGVAVGTNTHEVVTDDVDGDGDLDLIAANSHTGDVVVRLNNGAGTFSGTQTFFVGLGTRSLTLGDVDADGDRDLFTSNFYAQTVTLCLNNGTGTFLPPQVINAGPYAGHLAVGDVDGDGDIDLLNNTAQSSASGIVSVNLNGGTGPALSTHPTAPATPLTLAPNPAPADASVRITGISAHQPLTLIDATSRRIATLPADATGMATLRPNALAPGLYLLRTADGRTQRLVVE